MDNQKFNVVVSYLGEALLQFALNYNSPVDKTIYKSHNFNEDQLNSLNDFYKYIHSLRSINLSHDSIGERLSHWINLTNINGNNIFNESRKKCQGTLSSTQSEDKLFVFLSKFAVDYYPLLLMKSSISTPFKQFERTNLLNPSLSKRNDFIKLVKNDQSLRKLFNDDDQNNDPCFSFKTENGLSFHSQVICSMTTIISRAFENCCYKMKYDIDSYLNEIKELVNKLRDFAKGKEVGFSYFIGLPGIILQNTDKIAFSNCTIRSIGKQSNPSINLDLVTSLHNNEICGAVAELKYFTKLPQSKVNNSATYTSVNSSELYHFSKKCIDDLKFSICFGLDQGYAFIHKFSENGFPLVLPGNCTQSPDRWPKETTYINPEDIIKIQNWYDTLSSLSDSDREYIKTPLKRLDLAIHERQDPADGFVDALIAWESLFSGTPETAFKVVGSLTKFLALPENRAKKFKELTKLYGARSKIVHGSSSKESTPQEIQNFRIEAIKIGLNCLKKLIEYKKLLRMKPEDRCKALLVFNDTLDVFKEENNLYEKDKKIDVTAISQTPSSLFSTANTTTSTSQTNISKTKNSSKDKSSIQRKPSS